VPVLSKRGLLAPLRPENLPNLRNVDAPFLSPPYDPENRYSVPYQWGTAGIYMRKSEGRPVEETWGLIFDPAKQPGSFLLTEDIRFCFGAALQYHGHNLDSTNPKEIMDARDLLLEAKKRSSGFASSFAGKNRVLSKDAVLCIAYNNDAINGETEDPETVFFIPREGGGLWVDTLSIPANAPHRDLAEKFINYILEARTGARVSNFNRCATPNKAAREFINPADRTHPGIYPPPEIMKRLQMANDLGEANKLYEEMWTQIKSK
jgi:spermidine/putrescine transport system substrate-binding protein